MYKSIVAFFLISVLFFATYKIVNAQSSALDVYDEEFSIIYSDLDTVCLPTTINIDISASTFTDSIKVIWGNDSISVFTVNPGFLDYMYQDSFGTLMVITYSNPNTDTAKLNLIPISIKITIANDYSGECIKNNGALVNFTSNVIIGGAINNFSWNFGDGTNYEYTENTQHYYSYADTFYVTLSYNNGKCYTAINDTIIIVEDTSLIVNLSYSEGCPCNKNVSFTAELNNISSFVWDFGDGNTSSVLSPLHDYNFPGNYILSLAAVGSNGCLLSKEILVTVCNNSNVTIPSKSNNRWYFGGRKFPAVSVPPAGIEWDSLYNISALTDGQQFASEGAATMNDANTGALLFYTNGVSIWNRNHLKMPNGDSLFGSNSSTDAALIVPFPGNRQRYYVFTANGSTQPDGTKKGYYYNIIDMDSVAGLGNVIEKNIPLYTGPASGVNPAFLNVPHEALCGTIKKEGSCINPAEYWIVIPVGKDSFYSYLIDTNGVNQPVKSFFLNTGQYNSRGGSAFSMSGKQYAICEYGSTSSGTNRIRLFDFNTNTGTLVLNKIIPCIKPITAFQFYDVEFSPDGTKLYASSGSDAWQLDLLENNVVNSAYRLGQTFDWFQGLYRGIDNKIYLSARDDSMLSVIEYPNLKGAACNLLVDTISLSGRSAQYCLQNIIPLWSSDSMKLNKYLILDSTVCQEAFFNDTSCSFILDEMTFRWSFGDSTDTLIKGDLYPSHIYKNPGQYQVQLITEYPCMISDTSMLSVIIDTPIISVMAGNDTTIYLGEGVILTSNSNTGQIWTPSQYLSCSDCNNPVATPLEDTKYYVTLYGSGVCNSILDSMWIFVKTPDIYIPNVLSLNNDGINESFGLVDLPPGYTQYNLKIYDRFGQLVFESSDPNNKWNGQVIYNKNLSNVYNYFIQFLSPKDELYQYIGNITLLK